MSAASSAQWDRHALLVPHAARLMALCGPVCGLGSGCVRCKPSRWASARSPRFPDALPRARGPNRTPLRVFRRRPSRESRRRLRLKRSILLRLLPARRGRDRVPLRFNGRGAASLLRGAPVERTGRPEPLDQDVAVIREPCSAPPHFPPGIVLVHPGSSLSAADHEPSTPVWSRGCNHQC